MTQAPLPHSASMVSMCLRVMTRDGLEIQRYDLTGLPVMIGRLSSADVHLEQREVSRRHAQLYADPFGRWWVRDLGSRNGVRVNGALVREVTVGEGDEIAIEDYRLNLFRKSDPSDPDSNEIEAAPWEAAGIDDSISLDSDQIWAPSPQAEGGDISDFDIPVIEVDVEASSGSEDENDASKTLQIHEKVGGVEEVEKAFAVPIIEDDTDGEFRSLDGPGGASIETAHLATLKEFGFRLSRLPNAKERLNLMCRLMVRRDFYGEQACVLRVRKDQHGLPPEFLCDPQTRVGGDEDNVPHISRGLLNVVKQTDMPAMATQQPSDPGAVELSIDQSVEGGDMAAMACPLRSTRFFMDLLYVVFPAQYGTAEWLALVSLAAHQLQQTEIAIEAQQHAKAHAKIEEELAKAQQIQQRLIPENPQVADLDVNIGYKPCRWVGGDYADAFSTPDGRVLLCVADVSGKDLGAALITSSLHTMVHALVRAGQELGPIMGNLNDHLCEFLEDRSFVTMAAVMMDPVSGQMQYINAGHPPPLVFDADGNGQLLPSGDYYPLGVHDQPFEAQVAELKSGQMLAMATDGLTELTDAEGNMVGVGGLVKKLCEIRKLLGDKGTAQRVAEGLNEYLDRMQGMAVSQDDRTFLLALRP